MIIKSKCYNYNKICSLLCTEDFTNRNEATKNLRWWYYYAIYIGV